MEQMYRFVLLYTELIICHLQDGVNMNNRNNSIKHPKILKKYPLYYEEFRDMAREWTENGRVW